jgi:hypothetical protein
MCSDVKVNNNIVGGADYAAFLAPAHECGQSETQDYFRNNTAHSAFTASNYAGMGGQFFPKPGTNQKETCYEVSHFNAYKNWLEGAFVHMIGQEVIFNKMIMIDNR